METIIFALQVTVSVAFFSQKVLVLLGKKAGWLIGAITALVATIYFLLINLYCFAALDVGLIALMAYGFFIKKKSPKIEKAINIIIAAIMLILVYSTFTGLMSIIEFISSIGLMIGTYWLTHQKVAHGWAAYTIAHILASIVGYGAEQHFFADFQVASAIITFIGLWTSLKEV